LWGILFCQGSLPEYKEFCLRSWVSHRDHIISSGFSWTESDCYGGSEARRSFLPSCQNWEYTEFWPEEPKKVVAKKEEKKVDKPKEENKEEKKEAAKEGKEVGFTSLPLGKLQLV
jgi:hypothetical protein